jgi:hypothetical protein
VVPYVLHRLPAFWEEPDVFDPERFLPERSAQRPRFVYLPFGAGPRQCIGNQFALIEAHLIVPTLAQRYRLHILPGHAVEPWPLITLRPRWGMPMIVKLASRTRPRDGRRVSRVTALLAAARGCGELTCSQTSRARGVAAAECIAPILGPTTGV